MKATGGAGLSNRGGGKTRQGGGSVKTKKTVPRKTKDVDDSIIILREALFTPSGADKDVTAGIAPPFMKFNRNGLDLVINFSSKLSKAESKWAFELTKNHMEDVYDASGYGWDDEDKMRELTEQGARFLIVRERVEEGMPPGPIRAFIHFRFTVQGEVMDKMAGDPCVYVWDIQLEENIQGKGLGRHLLLILDLIGRQQRMKHLCVPVQLNDERTTEWLSKIKGFGPDTALEQLVGFDPDMEGFEVYSKPLCLPTAMKTASPSSPTDVTATEKSPVTVPPEEVNVGSDTEEDAEGEVEDEGDEEPEMNQEDIINGLQVMFREKHGRDATEEEVAQWMEAINSVTDKLQGVHVDDIETEIVDTPRDA